MRTRQFAFTMVEMLIVIGIITMLLAILLPSISKVRHSGDNVKCLANLRQLSIASQLHAIDYKGRIAPAGRLEPGSADAYKGVQCYIDPVFGARPLPWMAAYAKFLAINIRADTVEHLTEDLAEADRWKIFTCPSQRRVRLGSTGVFNESTEAPPGFSSYGFNEQITGVKLTGNDAEKRRRFGRIGGLRHSTKLMLFGDALPRQGDRVPGFFQYWGDDNGKDAMQDPLNFGTLAETLMEHPLKDSGIRDANFDFYRHPGRMMNIAFLDGHCEGVPIGEMSLRNVVIDSDFVK